MQRSILFFILLLALTYSCTRQMHAHAGATENAERASNTKTVLTCKMMPEEMRQRKETVLKDLKRNMIERKELSNGYAFKFPGNDMVLDQLIEFIKTERECCDFFVFDLSVSGDKSEAWLSLTGVEGAKDFITQELGL